MTLIVIAILMVFVLGIATITDYTEEEEENGSNRRTDQEIRGDSSQRTDASGGPVYAAGPSGTISLTSGASAARSRAGAGVMWPLPSLTPAQLAAQKAVHDHINAMQNQQQSSQQHLAQHQMNVALNNALIYSNSYAAYLAGVDWAEQPKPVVENTGIVLGEIEGFRAWRIFNGLLVSMAVDDVWLPGEPMTAKDVDVGNHNGAHAFKTIKQAIDYSVSHENVAIGRVKLWGQIIEHELGYRAEFSKPIEIISCRWRKLDGSFGLPIEIAKRYGIKFMEITKL
jgi:hypothetical protein